MRDIVILAAVALVLAVAAWSFRRRPVELVSVVCADGTTRELPIDDPRVADYLRARRR